MVSLSHGCYFAQSLTTMNAQLRYVYWFFCDFLNELLKCIQILYFSNIFLIYNLLLVGNVYPTSQALKLLSWWCLASSSYQLKKINWLIGKYAIIEKMKEGGINVRRCVWKAPLTSTVTSNIKYKRACCYRNISHGALEVCLAWNRITVTTKKYIIFP